MEGKGGSNMKHYEWRGGEVEGRNFTTQRV